jgi:hypothetical protein
MMKGTNQELEVRAEAWQETVGRLGDSHVRSQAALELAWWAVQKVTEGVKIASKETGTVESEGARRWNESRWMGISFIAMDFQTSLCSRSRFTRFGQPAFTPYK